METVLDKVQCELCGKEFTAFNKLSVHISKFHSISKKDYYDTFLKKSDDEGNCAVCGKPTKFKNIAVGYASHCSTKCSSLDPLVQDKLMNTLMEKYGKNTSFDLKKSKQTKLERYGDENYNNSEKRKSTCLERYGTESYMNTDEFKCVSTSTKLEKYGDKNYNNSDKSKQTKLEKYGSEGYNNREKAIATSLEKYGHTNPMMLDEIQVKAKQTKLEKYGDENYNNLEKSKQTCLNKYGVKYSFQSDNNKIKSKQTCLEKYGVEYITQSDVVKTKSKKSITTKIIEFCVDNDCTPVIELIYRYGQSWYKNNIVNYLVMDGDHKFVRNSDIFKIEQWSNNNKNNISGFEQSVKDFIQSICSYDIIKTRKEISPYEIDLFIPQLKIGIECNGTYWHSTLCNTDKYYHFNKSNISENKGIRLIHIYEYEWNDSFKRNIIKSMLCAALGSVHSKLYARNCIIKRIDNSIAKPFNELNHLQGHRNAQVTYGLFYDDKLVQLMSFSRTKYNRNLKNENSWEIIRGCPGSNNIVIGGVSKLFKHFVEDYQPSEVFSYCDYNKFDGKGYEAIGMKFIGYTGPDMHWWLKSGEIVTRNPNKHKEYKENSIAQIWGAGSKKYIIKFDKKGDDV